MAAAAGRHRGPRRDSSRRQLRGPAAAAEIADQIDPRHPRSVRRRDRAAGLDLRRCHHAARCRPGPRRREPLVPRRLDERARTSSRRRRRRADRAATASTSAARSSKERSNFSIAVNGQNQYNTPNLNVALPNGTTRFDVLRLRQPYDGVNINGLLDYALTRDQTLRFGYSQNNNRTSNLGIGAYDLPERAYTSDSNSYTFRALEAGPIGRRTFINSRCDHDMAGLRHPRRQSRRRRSSCRTPSTAAARSRPGASTASNLTFASDVDYVRGIHSWRGGVQIVRRLVSRQSQQQLSGHLHLQQPRRVRGRHAASLHAKRRRSDAELLPRAARRCTSRTTSACPQRADAQPRSAVQLSDARRRRRRVRAAPWRHVGARRRAARRRCARAAASFTAGSIPGIWWQTVRFDGQHQRDVIITNPSYPDPGAGGVMPPANTYRLGDYKLNKNVRYSAGIDQRFSPRAQRERALQLLPSGSAAARDEPQSGGRRRAAGSRITPTSSRPSPTPRSSGTSSSSTSTSACCAAVRQQRDDVQLAAARGERQLLVHPRAAKCARPVRRAGERHARHRMGPRARPTIRIASTSTLTSTQLKNVSLGLLAECVGRISLHVDHRVRRQRRWTAERSPGRRRNLELANHADLDGERPVSRTTFRCPTSATGSGPAAQRYRAERVRQRQQSDEPREPDRIQRRHDVAVLHDGRRACRIRGRWTLG